ncbi:unnamed protein product [Euphydryas editha]|uniref:Uncharacterized protein n=1 Tax=Euphydryas editha TaxID=104508 RepID=A0AAU9TTP7_EUPED|nr:unnamed protein product [Euphydryas editha]
MMLLRLPAICKHNYFTTCSVLMPVISHSSHVCMTCWLRTKREVERSSHQDQGRIQPEAANNEQEGQLPMESNELSHSSEVVLPNYKRAANTSNHCVFPNCRTTTLHTISNKLQALVLSDL